MDSQHFPDTMPWAVSCISLRARVWSKSHWNQQKQLNWLQQAIGSRVWLLHSSVLAVCVTCYKTPSFTFLLSSFRSEIDFLIHANHSSDILEHKQKPDVWKTLGPGFSGCKSLQLHGRQWSDIDLQQFRIWPSWVQLTSYAFIFYSAVFRTYHTEKAF